MKFNREDCVLKNVGTCQVLTHKPTDLDCVRESTYPLESMYTDLHALVLLQLRQDTKRLGLEIEQEILKLVSDDA